MSRTAPEERWRKHVYERFTALRQSGELEKLRAEGQDIMKRLGILTRKRLLTTQEWWQTFSQRASSPEYRAWHDKCRIVGERFGLAPWVVAMACLLRGYQPEKQPHVMEAEWPRIRVVSESTEPLFLQWLSYEAQRLGLYVIQRHGSVETTLLNLNGAPSNQLSPSQRPPRDRAFYMRVETPPGYPPEAASQLHKEAGRLAKELLRRLGYSIPQRLRTSRVATMADKLRVADEHLACGDVYRIMDKIYGDKDITRDRQRRSTIKTRRHRLKKRLTKPYELEA